MFAVVEAHVNYRRPARLDDELLISCEPVPEGRASIRFKQTVRNAGTDQVLAEGEVRVACVDAATFRPRPLPPLSANAAWLDPASRRRTK